MEAITLPAHFDGQQIVLDAPYELTPNTPLFITIVPDAGVEEERAEWTRFGLQNLAAAYGDNEPEYTLDDIKEWNPLHTGPREWQGVATLTVLNFIPPSASPWE